MRAISLWQPWASAMALGLKTIETRSWSPSVRGRIAIHAAKRWTSEEREFAQAMGLPAGLPLGAVVAMGTLKSVIRTEAIRNHIHLETDELRWGNYADGRFAWVFEDIVALDQPVPFKGSQGFFDVPFELLDVADEPRLL